ncbi:MAG: sigma-70 family RNA polymerase sigma factor [Candidatus Hydrogenedentes bacterium]|nr:sigma-70 family RNA polymerase sigma factor [Candidatus Hydrogenedentota bacterium]
MSDYTECTDEQLMISLREGDDSALEHLVKRYQNDVFRFCLHYVRNLETARELSQEVFLRVYTARDRFDPKRIFRSWMLCIARNMCLNVIKHNKIVRMESLEGLELASNAASPDWYPVTAHPLEGVMADERRRTLLHIVNDLPEDARELVMMRYFEEMSAREIAEVVEITEGAVRTRTHRALNLLRERCAGKMDILS